MLEVLGWEVVEGVEEVGGEAVGLLRSEWRGVRSEGGRFALRSEGRGVRSERGRLALRSEGRGVRSEGGSVD